MIKNKGKQERFSKEKLLKGCQVQNVSVLAILECLEFQKFPCEPTIIISIPWPLYFVSPELLTQ